MQYFGKLAWQVYAKLGIEFTRSLNVKDCTKIVINLEYVLEILFDVRYRWKVNDMAKPKT